MGLEPTTLRTALGAGTEERDHSLVITRIEPDSPASRAGLSKEDEILALDGARTDGRKLANPDALQAAIRKDWLSE